MTMAARSYSRMKVKRKPCDARFRSPWSPRSSETEIGPHTEGDGQPERRADENGEAESRSAMPLLGLRGGALGRSRRFDRRSLILPHNGEQETKPDEKTGRETGRPEIPQEPGAPRFSALEIFDPEQPTSAHLCHSESSGGTSSPSTRYSKFLYDLRSAPGSAFSERL